MGEKLIFIEFAIVHTFQTRYYSTYLLEMALKVAEFLYSEHILVQLLFLNFFSGICFGN